jgi:hypothetical protein
VGVEVADGEIFIVAALPAGADCHDCFFRLLWDWLFRHPLPLGAIASHYHGFLVVMTPVLWFL